MEVENEDVDYADIAILKEVLADPRHYEDDCENDQFENNIAGIISDEEVSSLSDNDEDEVKLTSAIDIDEIELDNAAPSARMCRALGSAYYDLLYITEKQLQTLLEKCRAKIKDVQDRIDVTRNQASLSRNNWYYIFGIPYFKDRRYFPCPSNEDHIRKLVNKELSLIDLPPLRQWKTSYKIKLEEAIKSEEIENQIKEANSKGLNDSQIDCIKKKTLTELVGSRKSEYDWMQISVQTMDIYYSSEECRSMWFNYLHPMIKKSKWDDEEDKKLIELVKLHKNQNWDVIADELGTNRSGYQCMCQYQTRLNDQLKKSKWTKEEDDYLRDVVDSCRVGSYIPWPKVTSFMDGRNKNQVFNRWAYSLDPNIKRSRFTEKEDILCVAAVRRYGTDDFKRVARFLPGRTSIQVRDRYNSYLKYRNSYERWTPHDDNTLLALVREHGEGNWSKISEHFSNRSRTQVRHRYTTIQSWMNKMQVSDGNLSVPTRKLNIEDNREERIWGRVQSILRGMKSSSLEINQSNLMKLKEKFNLDHRKCPGRKLGQKKAISKIEKEYYNFFRCVYAQFGGRRKQYFDEEVTQNITQAVQVLLDHFKVRLNVPKSLYAIEKDHLLDETDRTILLSLKDKVPTGVGKKGMGSMTMPTVIEGSVSDERFSVNVTESSASSQSLKIVPGYTVSSNVVNNSFVSCGEHLSSTEEVNGNKDAALNSNVSGIPLNSSASSVICITVPGSEEPVIKSLGINRKQLSAATASNILTNSFRTYGKKLSSVVPSNMITHGKLLSNTQVALVNQEGSNSKDLALKRTINITQNSSVALTVFPGSSATFSKNVLTSNVAANFSESSTKNPVNIPYFCPPNHTTLVGYRTLILSRLNISRLADPEIKDTPLNMLDQHSEEDASSQNISPSTAASLWKERFFSLFLWPALMSNVVPLMMDHVFKTEDEAADRWRPKYSKAAAASTSNYVTGKAQKVKKTTRKKRKRTVTKKKEMSPDKKRKYEISGKFKSEKVMIEEPRRSVRHSLNTRNNVRSNSKMEL